MEKSFEKGPERIPSKAEVMEVIAKRVESVEKQETLREINDEQGLKLLDLRFEGKEPGETVEFLYTRAGVLPNGVPTALTSIEVSYYQDGDCVGGDRIAVLDPTTGVWENCA
ncbi:MAG: hypothetical protein M3Q73_01965 [bacterium]|nr:hypothetical protein [bacterium]